MSLWSRIKNLFQPEILDPVILGAPMNFVIRNQTPAELYRSQHQLQRVISFRARNVAQLGLHAFHRKSDTDRERAVDSPIGTLLARPNPVHTLYDLLTDLVSNYDLYGAAYWLILPSADSESGWQIWPISPEWVQGIKGGTVWQPAKYVLSTGTGRTVKVDADDILVFKTWAPGGYRSETSPIEALKDVLAEQVEAWQYRRQLWQRGGRVGAYIVRPAEAGEWSDKAKSRFMRDWSQFQGQGAKAGSTPVLEDGMELKRAGFSSREEEWAEATKLSLEAVAGAYHVDPAMLGDSDGSSFSSIKELRSMLYTETLGPLLKMIEERISRFLIPKIDPGSDVYVEFNIEAKLAGNFEEQARIFSTATGGPWMTVNEARARRNLPSIEGADDLIVPLNVIRGGQASPQDGEAPSIAVENAREGEAE